MAIKMQAGNILGRMHLPSKKYHRTDGAHFWTLSIMQKYFAAVTKRLLLKCLCISLSLVKFSYEPGIELSTLMSCRSGTKWEPFPHSSHVRLLRFCCYDQKPLVAVETLHIRWRILSNNPTGSAHYFPMPHLSTAPQSNQQKIMKARKQFKTRRVPQKSKGGKSGWAHAWKIIWNNLQMCNCASHCHMG